MQNNDHLQRLSEGLSLNSDPEPMQLNGQPLATGKLCSAKEIKTRLPYEPGKVCLGTIDGQVIGHYDKAHQLTVGGSQSGKSAAFSNHLCDWPGSLWHFTTKGSDASRLAHRRGPGNKYCKGLGQKAVVIDPENMTLGVDEFKTTVNLIDGFLNPLEDHCFFRAFRLAVSFIPLKEGEESAYFKEDARGWMTDYMRHVCSSPYCEGRRNVLTVYRFSQQGDKHTYNRLIQENKMPLNDNGQPLFNPFDVLFDCMRENTFFDGDLEAVADYWDSMRSSSGSAKQFQGVQSEVTTSLRWLSEPGWRRVFGG